MFASAAIGCALGDASHTLRVAAPWKRREIALVEVALAAVLASPDSTDASLQAARSEVASSLSAMCLSAGDEARARVAAQLALSCAPDQVGPWTAAGLCALRVEHAIVSFEPNAARAQLGELAAYVTRSEFEARQRVELGIRGERSLEVQVTHGYFATPAERLSRDPARNPFRAGDSVVSARLRAQVLEVDDHGAPTRERFDFAAPLEELQWLCWEGRAPQPCSPPTGNAVKRLAAISPS